MKVMAIRLIVDLPGATPTSVLLRPVLDAAFHYHRRGAAGSTTKHILSDADDAGIGGAQAGTRASAMIRHWRQGLGSSDSANSVNFTSAIVPFNATDVVGMSGSPAE